MSKNVIKNTHWLDRTGSYSTVPSKKGVNLLGWEEDESLTPDQEREALQARVFQIHELFRLKLIPKEERKKYSDFQMSCEKRINEIRPKMRRTGLESFFMQAAREHLTAPMFREILEDAKQAWNRAAGAPPEFRHGPEWMNARKVSLK